MVLLWKKSTATNKGIIIFTHKEIYHNFIPFHKLKHKYFIGLHIGCWWSASKKTPNYVDFIMSSPNQMEKQSDKYLIPYNSRNFLPKYFDPYVNKNIDKLIKSINIFKKCSNVELPKNLINNINSNKNNKFWDIITVAKPHRVKKLDLFLREIKKAYEINTNLKVLIISAIAPNEHKYPTHHHNLEKIIKNEFTEKQQQLITLFRPECGTNEGIDNKHIFPFYQWSKIFCFFTEFEGESRVAHEALCCGLPIVCYKQLKGGANEYLNDNNSRQFDSYDNAYKSIIDCVNNYDKLNVNYEDMLLLLREDKSIHLIKKEFANIYKKNNMIFDNILIDYDQLHFRLPGHYYYDEWAKYSDNETSDILNPTQWNIFVNSKINI